MHFWMILKINELILKKNFTDFHQRLNMHVYIYKCGSNIDDRMK